MSISLNDVALKGLVTSIHQILSASRVMRCSRSILAIIIAHSRSGFLASLHVLEREKAHTHLLMSFLPLICLEKSYFQS